MAKRKKKDTYQIKLDGEWSLEDLYTFPRTFEQVYFLLYSLSPEIDEYDSERITRAYEVFPWQGGYSAVNFYNDLKYITRKPFRPQIVSIQKSSPGHLELALLVSIATNLGFIVKEMAKSIQALNKTYSEIYREMQKRKLMRIKIKQAEIQLSKAQLKFVEAANKKLASAMKLENLDAIEQRTGHPYRTLKILLPLYRRLRTLAGYQNSGKADFES